MTVLETDEVASIRAIVGEHYVNNDATLMRAKVTGLTDEIKKAAKDNIKQHARWKFLYLKDRNIIYCERI